MLQISDLEFGRFRKLLLEMSGISLSEAKKPLVAGRLYKRLHHFGLGSFDEYFRLLHGHEHPGELQVALNLLTTNETFFFREHQHFDFLRQCAAQRQRGGGTFRVWSAACSSGQEPYSIAMVLDDVLGSRAWEVVASDISTHVLAKAREGHYPLSEASRIPKAYLERYCLKGIGAQEGTLLVERSLRERVSFLQVNLNAQLPDLGLFDVIFLRNVMIYFEPETKRQVVQRLRGALAPGGHFLTGHSETLNGIDKSLNLLAPSIYQNPPGRKMA